MSEETPKEVILAQGIKLASTETDQPISNSGFHAEDNDSDVRTADNNSVVSFQPPDTRDLSPVPHSGRIDGGRSTPVPKSNRYQYQPSVTDSSHLGTDVEGYLPLHRMQTYIAVNPFSPSVARGLANLTLSNSIDPAAPHHRPSIPTPPPAYQKASPFLSTSRPLSKDILVFLFDVVPRQIYLHILLTLPSLYFSRVARIFEEAELSMPDIKKMAIVTASRWKDRSTSVVHANWSFEPSIVSPQYQHLKVEWEHFIDSLLKEWKTLNIVSVLLLSAILTTLQIDGAYNDPIARNAALLALVCAIMSLLYGCLYILRFNTMRRSHKAAEWAKEAQETKTAIFWNVWVLLAMPSIWLSWSIICYLVCIMSFVWRTGTSNDAVLVLSPSAALGPRIAITSFFVLGIIYFFLIVSTFRRYGAAMDRSWQQRVREWVETPGSADSVFYGARRRNVTTTLDTTSTRPHPPIRAQSPRLVSTHHLHGHSWDGETEMPSSRPGSRLDPSNTTHFKTVKVMDLRFRAHASYERPSILSKRNIWSEDWAQFIADVAFAWDGQFPRPQQDIQSGKPRAAGRSPPQDVAARYIAWWNAQFFHSRGAQAVLCQEYNLDHPFSPSHAIYLLDLWAPLDHEGDEGFVPLESSAGIAERFGSVPEGLERIDVYNPLLDSHPDNQRRRTTRMGKTMIFSGRPHATRVHWETSGPARNSRDISEIANDVQNEARQLGENYTELLNEGSVQSGPQGG